MLVQVAASCSTELLVVLAIITFKFKNDCWLLAGQVFGQMDAALDCLCCLLYPSCE